MAKPTPAQIEEDLSYASEFAGRFTYAHEDGHLVAQEFSEAGEIIARYPVTVTVGDPVAAKGDTETFAAGSGKKNQRGRLGVWVAGIVGSALLASILYQLVFEPMQPASNAELRDAYGVTVFPNPHFTGDTFLMYSEAEETEGLAEICERPSKRELTAIPELECYVPGIDK